MLIAQRLHGALDVQEDLLIRINSMVLVNGTA